MKIQTDSAIISWWSAERERQNTEWKDNAVEDISTLCRDYLNNYPDKHQSSIVNAMPWIGAQKYGATSPIIRNNKLQNPVQMLIARLAAKAPALVAYPRTPTPQRVAAAAVANDLLRFVRSTNGYPNNWKGFIKNALTGGSAAMKVVIDPDTEEVKWIPITVHDFLIDDRDKIEDSKWVAFKTFLDMEDLAALLRGTGIQTDDVSETVVLDNNRKREGAWAWEVWVRPCHSYPKGLWLQVVGDHVVRRHLVADCLEKTAEGVFRKTGQTKTFTSLREYTKACADGAYTDVRDEYPYIFDDITPTGKVVSVSVLPIAIFPFYKNKDTLIGESPLWQALPDQDMINTIDGMFVTLAQKYRGALQILPKELENQIQERSEDFEVYAVQLAFEPRYVMPPPVSPVWMSLKSEAIQNIADKLGVGGQLSGAEKIASTTSARKIAYLAELDEQKQVEPMGLLIDCIIRISRITLMLIQKYWDVQQITAVSSKNAIEAWSFDTADLIGMDIIENPEAGTVDSPIEQQAIVEEDAAAGRISPTQVRESRETGSQMSIAEEEARRTLSGWIEDIANNRQPIVDDEIDPALMVGILDETISVLQERPMVPDLVAFLTSLDGIKQYYQETLQAQQEAAAAMPAAQEAG